MRRFVLLGLLAARPAAATVLEAWDTARLVAESDAVVEARVLDARAVSPDGRNIVTETRLRVTRWLVGRGAREIVVSQHGGEHGGRRIWIPGSPSLPAGADVVVFLVRGAGRLWVAGMAQGVYAVKDGVAHRRVPVPTARAGGGAIAPAGAADRAVPIAALRAEIRAAARARGRK